MRCFKHIIMTTGLLIAANAGELSPALSPHTAKVQNINGAPGIMLDGKPFGSMGISSLFLRNMSDRDIKEMMGETGFRLNHLTFTLGEDRLYLSTLNHGTTWTGPDTYDWTPLDSELKRIQTGSPDTKIVLQVDLDGAKWWTKLHPGAASDIEKGIPDYLHDQWRQDSRKALFALVDHLESGPYRGMVIAYTLFNGPSFDCNWRPNLKTPQALQLFRQSLRQKYQNDPAKLQAAWHDLTVNFDNAMPSLERNPALPDTYPLLHSAAGQRQLDDTMHFRNYAWQQVILNFARDIKAATGRRALTGARCGNLFFGYWGWEDQGGFGRPGDVGSENVNLLLESPDFDYFDQWASYFGRVLGDGDHGGPVMPPAGVANFNKLILLQNDIPTHQNNEPGYGATKGLAETRSMQRRVFAHALTQNMYPYLWQMSSSFNVPELMTDWQTMEQTFAKSMHLNRDSQSEIAIVADRNFHNYLGKDTEVKHPTRGMALIDYGRLEWGRAGVGFDMIYLDQLKDAKPYRVYLFYHTLKIDEPTRQMIHQTMKQNHAVAVFVWADGIIDQKDEFSTQNMSQLVGMTIVPAAKSFTWQMTPSPTLRQQGIDRLQGVSSYVESCDTHYPERSYPPCLQVKDRTATVLARQADAKEVTLAQKELDGWTSIYSASPVLTPELLRYLIRQAKVFEYLAGDDALYLNASFVGVHTRKTTHEITLNFPEPTALYEVFNHTERPASKRHTIAVEPSSTYLFFRGSRAAFDAVPQ